MTDNDGNCREDCNEVEEFSNLVGTSRQIQPKPPTKDYPQKEEIDSSKKRGGEFLSCWANSGENYWGIAKTYETLPSKCYKVGMSNQGAYLEEIPVITDDLLVLPDDASQQIIEDFEQFWSLKPYFQERGFLHKRGILMWGPPGSGKTSTVQLIIQKVIHNLNGIVIMVDNPNTGVEGLKIVRKIEPHRPVIAVMEDLDSLVSRYDDCGFLAMLDGEAQVDNIVSLATTNYPERLDPRFVDRPSRFDVVRKIGMPSAEARMFYLQNKEPSLSEEELIEWVKLSEGMTIPHLKEMIISVKCYNKDLNETVERLSKMQKRKFDKGGALGFGSK